MRTRLSSSNRPFVIAVLLATTACTAGRFRYDRLDEKDGVILKDLEDLMKDGADPLADDVEVKQLAYDFAAERDEYRLGNNDVLNIYVVGHPEMSSQRVNLGEIAGTTVRKDGKVHLPVIGSIPAKGLTLNQFEAVLREAVAKYVVDPHVNVEILHYESQKFYVLGEVRAPGAFPVDGDTTLLEGLSLAGGVPRTGNLEGAVVVRNGQVLPIDIAEVVRNGDISRNIYMRAGDIIFVPDVSDQKVYVLGEVLEPTVVPITNGRITLAEALATAGGPRPAHARREIAIIRGGYAKPVVYRIDLDKAILVDDRVLLRPGDRVVVAPTGLATASRYMQQILPFLLGAQNLGIAAQGTTNVVNQATR